MSARIPSIFELASLCVRFLICMLTWGGAQVEVHLVIEVKTALQIAPEALRDGVVPIFELYAKAHKLSHFH